MKKLKLQNTLIFSVLMFLLLSTVYSCHPTKSEQANLNNTMEVGLKFGKGRICIGSGICIMESPNEFGETSYDALGKLIYEDGKAIELLLNKNTISEAKAKEQFGKSYFEIEEDVDFESEKGIIKKGKYIFLESDEYYTLSLLSIQ